MVASHEIRNGQAQSVVRTIKKLPDTGQNTSYTNTFGEDNDYTINLHDINCKLIKTYKSETASKGLNEIIFNDETIKNLPTGQYVLTLFNPKNTVVSSKIITKENP